MTGIDALDSADDVSRLAFEMFDTDLACHKGVVHVAAVVKRRGEHHVFKITLESPKSTHDTFVLSLSRARAQVIVTTGRILREEPDLTHDYLGPERSKYAMTAWRREVVGLKEPPEVLILTSGKGLDSKHPVFSSKRPVTIFTSPDGAGRLRDDGFTKAEIVANDQASLRRAIGFAMGARGAETVTIEAGPSTTVDLYSVPVVVDELLLSTFHGDIAMSLLAGSFLAEKALRDTHRLTASHRATTKDGDWTFTRYVRR